MGDHRPKITAHFEMHGHVADFDFGWCNWSPNAQGVDQRVIDWFAEQARVAMGKWQQKVDEAMADQRRAETEKLERIQLAALKAKYED